MKRWMVGGALVCLALVMCHEVALGRGYDSSSATHRQGKTLALGLGSDGYAVGLYFGGNALLEAIVGTSYNDESAADEWQPETIRTGLTLKLFRGNSFYSQFGVKHDQFMREESIDERTREATAYATFGLGNQWQWDYFTFGVRWLDFYLPVMNRVKVVPDAQASIRAAGPHQFRPHMEWLGLYAGIAF